MAGSESDTPLPVVAVVGSSVVAVVEQSETEDILNSYNVSNEGDNNIETSYYREIDLARYSCRGLGHYFSKVAVRLYNDTSL